MELLINTLNIKEGYTAQELNELTNRLIIDYDIAYNNYKNLDLAVIRANLNHFKIGDKYQVSESHFRNFERFLILLKQNPLKFQVMNIIMRVVFYIVGG